MAGEGGGAGWGRGEGGGWGQDNVGEREGDPSRSYAVSVPANRHAVLLCEGVRGKGAVVGGGGGRDEG